jgi:hypothetical protein
MNKIKSSKLKIMHFILLILEITILAGLLGSFIKNISGGIGNPNSTVITNMNISAVYPEILAIEINGNNAITLNPNTTKSIQCVALIRDYNGESNIMNLTAKLFHNVNSAFSDPDDNNEHYTNDSCVVYTDFGTFHGVSNDVYHAIGNCSFELLYYADPYDWNCTITVNNSFGYYSTNSTNQTVYELAALEVRDTISYGTVNSTYVSGENFTNVSNAGNVDLNLSLKGWAVNQGDNLAMNCTLGSIRNISIQHEKYNLTNSSSGELTLAQAVVNYTNLSSTAVVRKFELKYRHEDSYNEATNVTYWRMYVPTGVGGTCQGNIQFGATKAAGT